MSGVIPSVLVRVLGDVAGTFAHTWPFLLISVVAAAAVTTYVGTDRVARFLSRRVLVAIGAAVLLATLTPFCSCGTTAVLLGMMASSAPWAPLVAFMVASPLTSPSELVFSAGLFGWEFALVFFVGTIVLGLVAGIVALGVEKTGWLRGQGRVQPVTSNCGSTCEVAAQVPVGVGPGSASVAEFRTLRARFRLADFGREFLAIGRKLLLFFLAFTAIGYLVIESIPTNWLMDYLGGDSPAAVPLAALLGIPAYLNTEASLPLLASLMSGGMGPGPAMAFLVTGAGTSVGAITGLLVIARSRVVSLVVALLATGAIALGWIAQALL
jgi:uncharacterized membrane protein YraQ (UPF0718 family)